MTVRTLAVGLYALTFVTHVAWSHLARVERRERLFVALNMAALLIYLALVGAAATTGTSTLTPIYGRGLDALLGLSYLVSCIWVYFLCWSLTERGFSLRILVDLLEKGPRSGRAIAESYSEGKGLQWMLSKRIEGLAMLRLVSAESGTLALTRRGASLTALVKGFRRLLSIR